MTDAADSPPRKRGGPLRGFLSFLFWLGLFGGGFLAARVSFGAEVGEPCNELVLSCRATRGVFTVNACVRLGPDPEDSFCSYACTADAECPEGWTCEAASAWSNVPGAVEDIDRMCRRPTR